MISQSLYSGAILNPQNLYCVFPVLSYEHSNIQVYYSLFVYFASSQQNFIIPGVFPYTNIFFISLYKLKTILYIHLYVLYSREFEFYYITFIPNKIQPSIQCVYMHFFSIIRKYFPVISRIRTIPLFPPVPL